MKKEIEEECVNLCIDMLKQIINTWKIMIKKIESSYLTYLDGNNLYGWTMSQKLPVNRFMWYNECLWDFNEEFIKNYDENSDGYFLEVDIEYPKQLFSSHKELPFLPERRKLEKVEKLVCSIEDKEKCVIHIKALKQALNHGLKLKRYTE